jgi:hypothetical protein
MKDYAKAAKELIDKAAKLTLRQEGPRQPAPIVLQASSSPQVPRPTVPIEARVSRFKQELLASRINLHELRRLAFQGIPDKDGLRAMTWKVLDCHAHPHCNPVLAVHGAAAGARHTELLEARPLL